MSLNASEKIRNKDIFELVASEVGIKITSYREDNWVYKPAAFQEELKRRHQKMKLSDIGTHGKDGVVERSIGTTVNSAKTMIMYQALL